VRISPINVKKKIHLENINEGYSSCIPEKQMPVDDLELVVTTQLKKFGFVFISMHSSNS